MLRALAAASALYCAAGWAQISADGTLGTLVSRTGNIWSIKAGTRVNSNLFQSFSEFNILQGERAIFSGPGSVQHIIGRVTGPDASNIDGLLRSTIPGADLWLINPKGVAFGQHARLDVGGSFYVSTADYVKLGSTGRLDAVNPAASVLTMAAPSAFGFLGGTRMPLTVTRSELKVPEGNRLVLAGGEVTLDRALVNAVGGDVLLVSVASAGEVAFGPSGITGNSASSLGRTEVIGSILNVSSYEMDKFGQPVPGTNNGLPAGSLAIRAGDVLLQQSTLGSDNVSTGRGKGVTIQADGSFTMLGGLLFSRTLAGTAAGAVSVMADSVTMTNSATINTDTSGGNGRGGDITIAAREIAISDSSNISARTTLGGSGTGGNVRITASERLSISDSASVATDSLGQGRGGNIYLAAPEVLLDSNARIASSSDFEKAGDITIEARDRLSVTGVVQTDTFGPAPGGEVRITAGEFSVLGGGQIRAQTQSTAAGAGTGGSVTATATNITVRDGGFISAQSFGTGNAGSIALNASGTLLLENHGSIRTVAKSADGGNISIRAGQLVYLKDSEITTSVRTDSGKGGNITIDPVFVVLDHGQVVAQAAKGQGGNITIVSDFFYNFGGKVDASSDTGISGSVQIVSPKADVSPGLVTLNASYLDASSLIRASCAAHAARGASSSLIPVGRGGLPESLFPYGVSALARAGEPPMRMAQRASDHLDIRCGQGGRI